MNGVRRWAWVLRSAARNLWRSRLSVTAAAVSITLALTLTTASLLLGAQVRRLQDHWAGRVDVTVYLCTTASVAASCNGAAHDGQIEALAELLPSIPGVADVRFEDRDAAFRAFTDRFSGSDLAGMVEPDAIPESFRIILDGGADRASVVAALTESVGGTAGVESIQDQRDVLTGFFRLAERVRIGAAVLAAVQALTSLALLAHLLRSSVEKRRKEIRVMSLVGTPARLIRAPFVLESLAVNLAGVALTSALSVGGVLLAGEFLQRASGTTVLAVDLSTVARTLLAVAGTAFGVTWVTTRLALRRRLREVR